MSTVYPQLPQYKIKCCILTYLGVLLGYNSNHERHKLMNTTNRETIRPGKTISTKELEVVANFTNGFSEHVMELSNGTLIVVGFNEDYIRIIEREVLTDPFTQIPQIVNATEEES